jgi:outer membrane protein TolC
MPVAAPSKKTRKTTTQHHAAAGLAPVAHAEIARRAYELYCARGGHGGDALADWLQAERELTTATTPAAPKRQRKTRSVN